MDKPRSCGLPSSIVTTAMHMKHTQPAKTTFNLCRTVRVCIFVLFRLPGSSLGDSKYFWLNRVRILTKRFTVQITERSPPKKAIKWNCMFPFRGIFCVKTRKAKRAVRTVHCAVIRSVEIRCFEHRLFPVDLVYNSCTPKNYFDSSLAPLGKNIGP